MAFFNGLFDVIAAIKKPFISIKKPLKTIYNLLTNGSFLAKILRLPRPRESHKQKRHVESPKRHRPESRPESHRGHRPALRKQELLQVAIWGFP